MKGPTSSAFFCQAKYKEIQRIYAKMHLVSPSSVFTAHLKCPGPGDLFRDALEDHRTKRLQYTNILKDKKKISTGIKMHANILGPVKDRGDHN